MQPNAENIEAFKEAMTRDISIKKIVVSDMDEVIVNITPKWASMIVDHMTHSKVSTDEQSVLNREKYYLTDWLGFADNDFALKLMCEQGDTFYDDLELTPMGRGLAQSLEQGILDELVILSHSPAEMNNTSKIRFVQKHFPADKTRLLLVDLNSSKADAINEHGIAYTTFIDDRLDIVQDVVANTDSNNKEFMMPELGYNKVPKELIDRIVAVGSTIGQYATVC